MKNQQLRTTTKVLFVDNIDRLAYIRDGGKIIKVQEGVVGLIDDPSVLAELGEANHQVLPRLLGPLLHPYFLPWVLVS